MARKKRNAKNQMQAEQGLLTTFHASFSQFAHHASWISGHPLTFIAAFLVIVVWAVTGPVFGYSDTWQLVINTGTTIITFLMVFLIQNTQNRDTLALQLKLSELIFAQSGARNRIAAIENLSDAELERLHKECRTRADQTLDAISRRLAKQNKQQGARKS